MTDQEVSVEQCPLRLQGEGRDVLKTLFLGGEALTGSRLHAVETVEERVGVLPCSLDMSQTLNVSEAVALHTNNPSANLQVVISVLRLCSYV